VLQNELDKFGSSFGCLWQTRHMTTLGQLFQLRQFEQIDNLLVRVNGVLVDEKLGIHQLAYVRAQIGRNRTVLNVFWRVPFVFALKQSHIQQFALIYEIRRES
jgi:hypothetical protein